MKKTIPVLILCISTISIYAQIDLDFVGNIMRLTSSADANKYIQLRTDGSGVDIDTEDFLWIHSLGVRIPNMDTVLTASANIVQKTDGTLALRRYKIGDFVQGGIVFWVDETGEHGLVCDVSDLLGGTGIEWRNGVYRVTNANGDGIGGGAMNTMLIIAQQTADNTSGNFAALICANLLKGGYGDWYLPSKEELNKLYQNKETIDASAIANGGSSFDDSNAYWSSTENGQNSAWFQIFDDGDQMNDDKDLNYSVRAIRAF